jgi:hypothetical protein
MKAIGAIHDGFKLIPGHERQYTPRSEYLFKFLQPLADDTLFLGSEYERVFDRFEMILALQYAHLDHPEPLPTDDFVWSPVGRFAWKYDSPLVALKNEANAAGSSWPPFQAGLFGGNILRFEELLANLVRLTGRLGWH